MANNNKNINELVSNEDTGPRPPDAAGLDAERQVRELRTRLDSLIAENSKLHAEISALHETHAAEIRMIRFELGDAQETLSQRELLTERLASDLLETRSHRAELETRLATSEESRNSEIARLKRQKRQLIQETEILNEKLRSKSEAINCLLSELANLSNGGTHSGSAVCDISLETEFENFETVEGLPCGERQRVTRFLVGAVGGKELRFPLFKNRLTIGRTPQNDIQLHEDHISRRHAVVVTEGEYTRIIDWGSRNGVFVNSQPIKEHFLKSGDIVNVGTVDFRYEERRRRD